LEFKDSLDLSTLNKKRLDYIENNEVDIDHFLNSNNFNAGCLQPEDEEQDLILNELFVKNNSQLDIYEIKNVTISLLIEITKLIFNIFLLTNNFSLDEVKMEEEGSQKQGLGMGGYQFEEGARQPSIVLNEDQCVIFGKILKNGLVVFEYFHDFDIVH